MMASTFCIGPDLFAQGGEATVIPLCGFARSPAAASGAHDCTEPVRLGAQALCSRALLARLVEDVGDVDDALVAVVRADAGSTGREEMVSVPLRGQRVVAELEASQQVRRELVTQRPRERVG